jgi:hypothetical protein
MYVFVIVMDYQLQYVARMVERRTLYSALVETPEGNTCLEDVGAGGRIILNWIVKNWNARV